MRPHTLEDSLFNEGRGDAHGRSTIGAPPAFRPWVPYVSNDSFSNALAVITAPRVGGLPGSARAAFGRRPAARGGAASGNGPPLFPSPFPSYPCSFPSSCYLLPPSSFPPDYWRGLTAGVRRP